MGVSIDSIFSHANWGRSLGGVSFPLLADFHPKGGLAESLGVYLGEAGITDRATVIIDREGIVRYSVAVGPGGQRDIDELAAECEKINAAQEGSGSSPEPGSVPAGTKLYVKSSCGFSLRTTNALANLHLDGKIEVCNVTEDEAAATELETAGGKNQAPALTMDGKTIYEADDITVLLANHVAPVS